jgi:hypothetical protein
MPAAFTDWDLRFIGIDGKVVVASQPLDPFDGIAKAAGQAVGETNNVDPDIVLPDLQIP